MPLTAPTTSNGRAVSIKMVDRRGDRTSIRARLNPAATNEDILELVEAVGAASQATVYDFTIEQLFSGTPGVGAAAALTGTKDSVDDVIVIGLKNPSQGANDEFTIPAPLPALFDANSENVNRANALYIAVKDELVDVLLSGWQLNQVRFTERREINQARQPA